jgi:uncharacterized protein (DUF302 family)
VFGAEEHQELGIGLLLPCNVCVWEEEGSVVSIARPEAMFELRSL